MDLVQNSVTCAACGKVQAIEQHVSQRERFALDMERQTAGNRALDAFYAQGVACTNCGGHLVFPDDGSIQTPCPHCGTTLVASQWVDATAVGRRRLKHAVFGMRDEMRAAAAERERTTTRVIVAVVVLGFAIAIAVALFAGS